MNDNGPLPIIGRAWRPNAVPHPPLSPDMRMSFGDWVRREGFERQELVLGPASGEPWEVIRIEGESAGPAWRVIGLLDGQRTNEDIAREARLDRELVCSVVQDLYLRAILVQASAQPVAAVTFYDHLHSLSGHAMRRWTPSPLMNHLWNGPVSRRLALGFLLENYHFAAAASSHQSAAVASLPTERLKTVFSEHLSIEYWHHVWLRRGLMAAGLTAADIERAMPVVSMQALINHLRWLAVSDSLSYSACIGVGEGDSLGVGTVQRFWARFGEHGVLPEEAYGPFRDHALGDCGDDHDQFGREPFTESGPLTAAEQARIRRRLLTFCRLTWAYHREVLDWYGPEEGPLYFSVED